MSTINADWKLKYTSNAIRRFLTQPINKYNIERLRVEFNYGLRRLEEIEKGLQQ